MFNDQAHCEWITRRDYAESVLVGGVMSGPETQAPANQMERLVIYAVYSDKGPVNGCGQCCSITNPWKKLHIFHDHDTFREWCRSLETITNRKEPKLEHYWIADGLDNTVVEHL